MNNKTPSSQVPAEFEDWKGNFDDLVATSSQILARINPEAAAPSGSVVRYYQQQGVVGRGTPKGRTREFSSKELEQVITAKQMAGQNIPLSLVKSALDQEGAVKKSAAELLVSDMMKTAGLTPGSGAEDGVTALFNSSASKLGGSINPSATLARGSHFVGAMAQSFGSHPLTETPQQYVTLPAGGTVRYELNAGTTVELSTHGNTQEQAAALHDFADQLLAGLNLTTKTS